MTDTLIRDTELEDVLRAVRYLDEHLGTPSWVHDVPTDDTLDLMECDACVLYHAGGRDPESSYLELSFALQEAHPDEPDRFWDVFADNYVYRERWITVLTRLRRERPLPACPHPDALQHLHYEYQPPITHARRVPTSTACQDCCDALASQDAQRAIGDYRENPHLYSRHPITLPEDHPLAQALRNSSSDPDDYEDLDLNDLP